MSRTPEHKNIFKRPMCGFLLGRGAEINCGYRYLLNPVTCLATFQYYKQISIKLIPLTSHFKPPTHNEISGPLLTETIQRPKVYD